MNRKKRNEIKMTHRQVGVMYLARLAGHKLPLNPRAWKTVGRLGDSGYKAFVASLRDLVRLESV